MHIRIGYNGHPIYSFAIYTDSARNEEKLGLASEKRPRAEPHTPESRTTTNRTKSEPVARAGHAAHIASRAAHFRKHYSGVPSELILQRLAASLAPPPRL